MNERMWMTVPSTDERLRRDLGKTVRPADPDELFTRLTHRRHRQAVVRQDFRGNRRGCGFGQ